MSHRENYENREIAFIDILDTVLDKGVVVKGDIVLSIAGIDLVYLDLKLLVSSVETLVQSHQENSLHSEEKGAFMYATERS